MRRIKNKKGFTLVEMMVTLLLFSLVGAAGMMLFTSGQATWSLTSTRANLQENLRRTSQKISYELRESGVNSVGGAEVDYGDNVGVSGTDILRFSVPICLCGMAPIDSNGDVQRWGAPLTWGQAGCTTDYPLDGGGNVDMCEDPTGVPTDINVAVSSVQAHLAHGDYIGVCGSCNTVTYNHHKVEYIMDANGQLVRRVLDSTNAVVASQVFAENLTDFQVTLDGPPPTTVTLTISLQGVSSQGRTYTVAETVNVYLGNT